MTELLEREPDLSLERAKKWLNLWFTRDGRSKPAREAQDSELEAMKEGNEFFFLIHEYLLLGHDGWILYDDGSFFCKASEISHFIPMPVGDA